MLEDQPSLVSLAVVLKLAFTRGEPSRSKLIEKSKKQIRYLAMQGFSEGKHPDFKQCHKTTLVWGRLGENLNMLWLNRNI